MGSALGIIKPEHIKKKDLIQFISGLITLVLAIISFVTKVFESKYTISLFLIGLLLIIQRLCAEVINSKRESFGILTQAYSGKVIKLAKIIKHASWSLLIFPIFIFSQFLVPTKKRCVAIEPHLGILITNFTNSIDDDFSYKLFNILESELESVDTIKTISCDNFVNPNKTNYLDTITNVFSQKCLNHGLLVFGKRSEQSKLFDCNIYIHNIHTLKFDSAGVKKRNILFLQNPNVVNFSIDNQAKIVSDFILALLFYNSGNFDHSIAKFKQANLSSSDQDLKLKSYCHLFIGNNLLKQTKISEAVTYYKTGIHYDSLNSYLHYNLATALLFNSDSLGAFYEYETARRLNSRFSNPIADYMNSKKNEVHNTVPQNEKKNIISSSQPIEQTPQTNNKDKIQPDSNKQNNEYQVVKIGKKYGIKNAQGVMVVPCQFDYIDDKLFVYQGFKFFIVQKASKYGAVSSKGYLEVPIIHPSIDYVRALLKTTIDLAPELITH